MSKIGLLSERKMETQKTALLGSESSDNGPSRPGIVINRAWTVKMLARKTFFNFNENKNQNSLGTFESLFELSRWGTFFKIFGEFSFFFLKFVKNSEKCPVP